MPELPEVETVKNTLKRLVLNKRIDNVKVIYPEMIEYPSVQEFINGIKGKTIIDIKRRGKWLLFELEDKYILSHLRMEGKFFIHKHNDYLSRHEHVVFQFNDSELRYHDTRKFGRMYLIDKDVLETSRPISELGLEPWDKNLTVSYLKDKYKNKRLPIKTALLDQSIIAGIGNIYADEILFLCKINPLRKSCELTDNDLENIIKYTKDILARAIKLGGTTIKSYESSRGVHGLFQNELLVHSCENKPCKECHSIIVKTVVGGRGTYFCPTCQK